MKKAEASFLIVAIVAVAAVVGLVFSFTQSGSTGAAVAGDLISVELSKFVPGDGDECFDGFTLIECTKFDFATGLCGNAIIEKCGIGGCTTFPTGIDCVFGDCGACEPSGGLTREERFVDGSKVMCQRSCVLPVGEEPPDDVVIVNPRPQRGTVNSCENCVRAINVCSAEFEMRDARLGTTFQCTDPFVEEIRVLGCDSITLPRVQCPDIATGCTDDSQCPHEAPFCVNGRCSAEPQR